MKAISRIQLLTGLSLFGAQAVSAEGCHANNCARAVTGNHQGPTFTSLAKADCSSFVKETVYGITVTVAGTPTPTSALPKTVPTYAEACTDVPEYISACSCYGIESGTVTSTSAVCSPFFKLKFNVVVTRMFY